jgi:multisubunit Na+/H+ antiporter MnhF subunit
VALLVLLGIARDSVLYFAAALRLALPSVVGTVPPSRFVGRGDMADRTGR